MNEAENTVSTFAASLGAVPTQAATEAVPSAAPVGGIPHPGAVPLVQAPANTNAIAAAPPQQATTENLLAEPPANTNATETPVVPEAAPAEAADPFAEEVHGMPLRVIIDAIKGDTLPETILQTLKGTVKIDGHELQIPLREALNGYQRLTDYTNGTKAVAAQAQQLNEIKAKVASLFAGWDKPEGFEKSVSELGLNGHVNAMVTKTWGSHEKPNLEGFFATLREMNAFPIFRAAANAYATDYARRIEQYNPSAEQYAAAISSATDPNERMRLQQRAAELDRRAHEMYAQYERDQDLTWSERVAARQEGARLRRETSARERAALLAQQAPQQQQPVQDANAVGQQISQVRTESFKKLGIVLPQATDMKVALEKFDEQFQALLYMARADGYQKPLDDIIREASEQTLFALQLDPKMKAALARSAAAAAATPQPAPARPAAPAAPAVPPLLSARPAGAPSMAPSPIGGSFSPLDFEAALRGTR